MRRRVWLAGLVLGTGCSFGADEYRFVARPSPGVAAGTSGAGAAGSTAGTGGASGAAGAGASTSAGAGGQATGGAAGAASGGASGAMTTGGAAGSSGAGNGGAAGMKPACAKGELGCKGKQELLCATDQSKLEPSRQCGPSATCAPGVGCVSPVEVVTGVESTCARYDDGTVRCWGQNDSGQLGIGSVGGKQPAPGQVVSPDGKGVLTKVTSLAVGWKSACAVSDGDVLCWGNDDNGQLGDGAVQTPESGVPAKTMMPVKARLVAGSLLTFCALGQDEQVWCWGSNGIKAVSGPSLAVEQPTVVSLPEVAAAVTVGAAAVCASTQVGRAICWGLNLRGEAASGATDALTHSPNFVRLAPGDPPIAGVVQTSVGGGLALGSNRYSHILLATGNGQTNGALSCWGWNEKGQCLIDGSTPAITTPQTVTGISPIQVSAGALHSCVTFKSVPTTPNVQCWGWNEHGQIGNGLKAAVAVKAPFTVPGVVNATVSAGTTHTCAVGGEQRDTIWCWGDDTFGQLGDGGFDPQPLPKVVVLP